MSYYPNILVCADIVTTSTEMKLHLYTIIQILSLTAKTLTLIRNNVAIHAKKKQLDAYKFMCTVKRKPVILHRPATKLYNCIHTRSMLFTRYVNYARTRLISKTTTKTTMTANNNREPM